MMSQCTQYLVPLKILIKKTTTKQENNLYTVPLLISQSWNDKIIWQSLQVGKPDLCTSLMKCFHTQNEGHCSKFGNSLQIFLIQLKSILLPRSLSSFPLALKSVYYCKVKLKLMCLDNFICQCSIRLILEAVPCTSLENKAFFIIKKKKPQIFKKETKLYCMLFLYI